MLLIWSLFAVACAPDGLLSEPVVDGVLTPSRSVLLSVEVLKGQASSVDLRLPISPGEFADSEIVLQFEEQDAELWTAELELDTLARLTPLDVPADEATVVPLVVHALRRAVSQGGGWGIEIEVRCDSSLEVMQDGLCSAP